MSTRLSTEELDALQASAERAGIFGSGALKLVAEVRASWADLDAARERTDLAALASVTQLENDLDAARRALRDLTEALRIYDEGALGKWVDDAVAAARAVLSEKVIANGD